MQIVDRVKNCNGCGACAVGCKHSCIKMEGEDGLKRPVLNENGCQKCNACILFCPLYNPVELPVFDEYYEAKEDVRKRDMPATYRQTMRSLKEGNHTEFVGTLCQIAALKSLKGDKIPPNLILYPVYCDEEQRKSNPACAACNFYSK